MGRKPVMYRRYQPLLWIKDGRAEVCSTSQMRMTSSAGQIWVRSTPVCGRGSEDIRKEPVVVQQLIEKHNQRAQGQLQQRLKENEKIVLCIENHALVPDLDHIPEPPRLPFFHPLPNLLINRPPAL